MHIIKIMRDKIIEKFGSIIQQDLHNCVTQHTDVNIDSSIFKLNTNANANANVNRLDINVDNYYTYNGMRKIQQNPSRIVIKRNMRINICAYTIDNCGYKPFIKYILYRYPDNIYSNLMVFPFFVLDNNTDIRIQSDNYLKTYISKDFKHMGYINNSGDIYMFYSIKSSNTLFNTDNNLKYVIISEILNYQSCYHYIIHDSVRNFFIQNSYLNLLYDKKGYPIQCPLVLYHSNDKEYIDFIKKTGLKFLDKLTHYNMLNTNNNMIIRCACFYNDMNNLYVPKIDDINSGELYKILNRNNVNDLARIRDDKKEIWCFRNYKLISIVDTN